MIKSEKVDWREDRRQSARDAIVAAAWALVHDEGLAGMSLRDLARRAGITTPTVYAYFESKRAIYDAMFGQAAADFAAVIAAPYEADEPRAVLLVNARRFIEFCTADVARYQLLFQHVIPDFEPSRESYAPAVRALDAVRELLIRNGLDDPRQLDMWTALMNGVVDQQISNDPGGDRWTGLIDEFVTMFCNHSLSERPTPARRSGRATTKGARQ
jgi:AcrR family transcriptional regulator